MKSTHPTIRRPPLAVPHRTASLFPFPHRNRHQPPPCLHKPSPPPFPNQSATHSPLSLPNRRHLSLPLPNRRPLPIHPPKQPPTATLLTPPAASSPSSTNPPPPLPFPHPIRLLCPFPHPIPDLFPFPHLNHHLPTQTAASTLPQSICRPLSPSHTQPLPSSPFPT